jgi:glycine C-acetyltransferase
MYGGEVEAGNLLVDLRENHRVFCSIVAYPVIPRGQILFRLIPTAMHTLEDVEYTLNAFTDCKKKLEAGKYKSDSFNLVADKLK